MDRVLSACPWILLTLGILCSCDSEHLIAQEAGQEVATMRPTSWAQPVELTGVPNLHQVTDHLYRSAQPSAEGMKQLREMGVETIINLRSFHSDRDEIGDTGLAYEHIYMKTWHPEEKEVLRFLQIVTNPRRQPVLVHCQRGADRTGLMCALYRVTIQGWSKEQAIREMTEGGYGFCPVWSNLIKYIQDYDTEAMRRRLKETTGGEFPVTPTCVPSGPATN